MPMESESVWPFPSESRRVRRFLYVSEGVILGAASLLFAVRILGADLVDPRTGAFDPQITTFGAFTVLLLIFFGLRNQAIKRVAPPKRETPLEYRDWSETRAWRWVIAVAVPVIGVLLGGAVLTWNWWEIVFRRGFDLLLLGTILTGVLSYIYVLHRLGM